MAARLLFAGIQDAKPSIGLKSGDWAVGTTLVFFKQAALEALGTALARSRGQAATRIQAARRSLACRRRFLALRAEIIVLQVCKGVSFL